jgi:hypothetical protein
VTTFSTGLDRTGQGEHISFGFSGRSSIPTIQAISDGSLFAGKLDVSAYDLNGKRH